MLTEYIEAAMRHAQCELLDEDGTYYCEIPVCRGVWANEATLDEARIELRSALEDWITLGLAMNDPLPEIDGVTIVVQGVT